MKKKSSNNICFNYCKKLAQINVAEVEMRASMCAVSAVHNPLSQH